MSLGTLAINNNSDQVAGTGTSFTTELKINDFIAVPSGGVTYTMVVKAIASDTALTITRPFSGPNVTGVNWAAIPAGTMVGVTAKIADDTAYTMRMYVNEANNWMSLLTIDGEVTVYAPDGSSYTGPSWLKLSHIIGTLMGRLTLDPTSDIDYKEDIQDWDGESALDNIDAMELVTFKFKADEKQRTRRGVIAQQIETIDPEYVHHSRDQNDKPILSLDTNVLLLDALAAIKVLSSRVKELEAKLESK